MTDSDGRRRVFLDSGGSAPLLPETVAAFSRALSEGWADPTRLHSEGRAARQLLEASRQAVAGVVGARTEEVVFAPSFTQACHRVLAAVHRGRRRVGSRVVVSAVERASILNGVRALVQDDNELSVMGVDRSGAIDVAEFSAALGRSGVAFACLQHANGEVGTLQPVAQAHAAARAAGVPLILDAGASLGHVEVPDSWDVLLAQPADWGGPAGAGVLVVRRGVRIAHSGPEDADRWFPGGVAVASAFATAVSLQAAASRRDANNAALRPMIAMLRERIPQVVPDVEVVGPDDPRLPHVLTFSCLYVDGESLVSELDREGFAVGSGSACTSLSLEPSHVLAAMGVLTHGNVRLNLHGGVSAADVERFLAVLPGAVARVRERLGVQGL